MAFKAYQDHAKLSVCCKVNWKLLYSQITFECVDLEKSRYDIPFLLGNALSIPLSFSSSLSLSLTHKHTHTHISIYLRNENFCNI